jgi:formamidopyrimidine-DNA glycosylase
MPEGPEVQRHADTIAAALVEKPLCAVMARTQQARAWLAENPQVLVGATVRRVHARGKNLLIRFDGELFCYCHLMMWGRWQVLPNTGDDPLDRRERARFSTTSEHAILLSAPIFQIHRGPLELVPTLATLGPDILPDEKWGEPPFDAGEFERRLRLNENLDREIGAILLDQNVLAGVGNYLRAEILFECRMDPWKRVRDLSTSDLANLRREIPHLARLAYESGGATLPLAERERMRLDPSLTYAGSEWGMRHWTFRRTNLPCLRCGDTIRQSKQTTRVLDDRDEKSRIIYFCPTCQQTSVALKPVRVKKPRASGDKPDASGQIP